MLLTLGARWVHDMKVSEGFARTLTQNPYAVGRTPWSAEDPPVRLFRLRKSFNPLHGNSNHFQVAHLGAIMLPI